ncbi:endonuclease/exonuclease/phosphatase family protein [Leadbettera azotonutricia]|uniref:Endonuclease/exonuclease/phosphatase family protein n=1 Tax=Leadbettera azotonutricia (strain ATCC BAA-888 / DSM 13862 / ZAS-9) TaxID=545695 RepID=F5YAN3_LEAAZ|nr:endonuclease/exonuclease/phosphatase family protein [Leadbettera azotonutricia]AEF80715.1 endonuclease/exonuclease/phosphatase family protein [Leadbettera azotonutricia ZAS-9]
MKYATRFFGFVLMAAILGACRVVPGTDGEGATEKEKAFIAVSWNVQALFDWKVDGFEYGEYLPSAGWNREKYDARILSISKALGGLAETGVPDLIGLVELENSGVLEDLANGALSKYGYKYMFFGNAPGSSLGVGALSRFPLTEVKVHSITVNGETTPRPVLELRVEKEGEGLVFFVCHWKSKLGGDEATEALRRSSAKVIKRRLEELHKDEPGLPVVVMGDLNENHDEFYRQAGVSLSALLPDDPKAAELAGGLNSLDFLVLSGEKPPRARYFNPRIPCLYTPWGRELEDGSYYYKNNWETIDHFLLSAELFNGRGWDFDTAKVVNQQPFANESGIPASYNPKSGIGMSDHLPLALFLRKADDSR